MAEKAPDYVTVFQTENNIHVLAFTLDSFFTKIYQQPPSKWAKMITESLLFPFLTRPVLCHACFYGERNQIGHSILASPLDEVRQNWLDWFVPLLTYQPDFVAPEEVEASPNALASGEQGPETIWATNMLLLCTCLHWSFMNRSSEDFATALQEIQPRCEVMSGGWNEIAASRVRALYKGLLNKVLKSLSKTDQDIRILDNIGVLATAIEEFVFYSPLCRQGPRADPSVVGVHVDANGVVCKDLLKLVSDIVQNQLRDTSGGTVLKMVDKKEKNEAKKRRELLEEIGTLFNSFLSWANCLAGTVDNYAQLKTMPNSKLEFKQEFSSLGFADGSHVRVNDRVVVHAKEGKSPGTLMYKGTVGSKVVVGVAFEDCVGQGEDTECSRHFKCLPGFGGFSKPENVQLASELVTNANYDKATTQMVDLMAKRPRFKNSNKKQALGVLEETVFFSSRLRAAARPKGEVQPASLNTSWEEVPFESVIEQAKAGAYTLRRAVRFLDKTLTAKASFAASLIKICQEEDTKTLADEMGSIAHNVQTSSEYCLAVRMRNFVNSVTLEVKTPFETLEKEYEVAVNEMKNICGRAEKEIETAREKLVAQMKEAFKVYEQVIQLKGEMQEVGSPKAIAAAAKLPNIVQKCGVMFVQYERACTEWTQKGEPAFRAFQKQGLAAFQLKEHRRLIATRTYLERYLAICTAFNDPYFQVKQHSELINNMAPHDDLACYAVQYRKGATKEVQLPQLPCSGSEVLTGTNEKELVSSPEQIQRAPPPAANPNRNKYGTVGTPSPLGLSSPVNIMPTPTSARLPPPRTSGSVIGLSNLIASPPAARRPPPRHMPRAESTDDAPRPEPLEDLEAEPTDVTETPSDEPPIFQSVVQPLPSPRAPPNPKYATVDSGGVRPPFRLPLVTSPGPIVRRLPRLESLPTRSDPEVEQPDEAALSPRRSDERPPAGPQHIRQVSLPPRGPPPPSRAAFGTMSPSFVPTQPPTTPAPVVSVMKFKTTDASTPAPFSLPRPASAERSKSPSPLNVAGTERVRSSSPSPHGSQASSTTQPSTTAQASSTGTPCHCGCATFVPQSFRKNVCVVCSHVH